MVAYVFMQDDNPRCWNLYPLTKEYREYFSGFNYTHAHFEDLVEIGTPHIAGYSADGKAMGTAMSVQIISRFFNLDLDNWFPENIPLPPDENIKINCSGLTTQEVLNRAVLSTYNIKRDDITLRNSVNTFEQQRGDYLLRREFNAYKTSLINDDKNNIEVLSQLGLFA